jgi:hypothetical protein
MQGQLTTDAPGKPEAAKNESNPSVAPHPTADAEATTAA